MPEPETPVTPVRRLSGNSTTPPARLCMRGLITDSFGKSTLTREVLFENLIGNLGSDPSKAKWKGCDIITGREPVARVLEVDQTPIGKTPRSCPATYVGFFDKIRALVAGTIEG